MNIKSFGKDYEVTLNVAQYVEPKNLAITLDFIDEDGFIAPFGKLTVNFDKVLPESMGYVDVNNMPEAVDFIERYKLGRDTGHFMLGAYGTVYPMYEFDMDRLNELSKQ